MCIRDRIIEDDQSKESFVIRPSVTIPIKRLERDPDKLQMMYDLGVKDTIARLDELKDYIYA